MRRPPRLQVTSEASRPDVLDDSTRGDKAEFDLTRQQIDDDLRVAAIGDRHGREPRFMRKYSIVKWPGLPLPPWP